MLIIIDVIHKATLSAEEIDREIFLLSGSFFFLLLLLLWLFFLFCFLFLFLFFGSWSCSS